METVFDLLMVYESEFFKAVSPVSFAFYRSLTPCAIIQESRIEMLLLQMLDQDSPEVQAIACEGVAKLMLSGIVADDKVGLILHLLYWKGLAQTDDLDQLLRSLVILYLTPETEDNQALRQCLSYFFPVYCYSSPVNQKRMQSVRFWSKCFA